MLGNYKEKGRSMRSRHVHALAMCLLFALLGGAVPSLGETPERDPRRLYEDRILECLNNPECRLESLFDDALNEKSLPKQWLKIECLVEFSAGRDYACTHAISILEKLESPLAREIVLEQVAPKRVDMDGSACYPWPLDLGRAEVDAYMIKMAERPLQAITGDPRSQFPRELSKHLLARYRCKKDVRSLEALLHFLSSIKDWEGGEKDVEHILYILGIYAEDGTLAQTEYSLVENELTAVYKETRRENTRSWTKTALEQLELARKETRVRS